MFSYIAPGAKQYRANLHSHTNLSDGTLTPEQMVQAYQEKGYSILAITDHEAPYDHTALSTDDFLMLTGYEAYIRPSPTCEFDLFKPEIHLNLLAKDPHNTAIIGWDPQFLQVYAAGSGRASAGAQGRPWPPEIQPGIYPAVY